MNQGANGLYQHRLAILMRGDNRDAVPFSACPTRAEADAVNRVATGTRQRSIYSPQGESCSLMVTRLA